MYFIAVSAATMAVVIFCLCVLRCHLKQESVEQSVDMMTKNDDMDQINEQNADNITNDNDMDSTDSLDIKVRLQLEKQLWVMIMIVIMDKCSMRLKEKQDVLLYTSEEITIIHNQTRKGNAIDDVL
eukprot:199792_1